MKEKWTIIQGWENYFISNKGRVRNMKTKKLLKPFRLNSQLLYVQLSKNGKSSNCLGIHTLVAKHFNKMKKGDTTAIHLNYVQFDNREPNVEGATRGQAIVRTRKNNRFKKNKIKGIYKWFKGKNKYRAIISLEDGKMGTRLLGYFKTHREAKEVYHKTYLEIFGREPFKLG